MNMPVPIPPTVLDFVLQRLASLSEAARLAVLFDPHGDLPLGTTLEVEGRSWRVYRYDGNDLRFRQEYRPGPLDLVWVTCPPGFSRDAAPRLGLNSLVDVWRRAEAFVDASLPGVLRRLAPNEFWPAASVQAHAAILGQNLPSVVSGVQALRRFLPAGAALDLPAIRALALHCLQPALPIEEFLFHHDTPPAVLEAYTGMLWRAPWSEAGASLLQSQAREAPRLELGSAAAWLDVAPGSLALYLYLRRLLARHGVRGIANQLRGLGVLDFDPELLEPWAESVLARWETEPGWRHQVILEAEERLQPGDLTRLVGLLGLDMPAAAFDALARADTPAAVYALGVHWFRVAYKHKKLAHHTPMWAERKPAALAELPTTPFSAGALALTALFDELALINRRLTRPLPEQADLAELLDWYVGEGIYDLEYSHARAGGRLPYLPDEELRGTLQRYLDHLKAKIREYLDKADHVLAAQIAADWPGYLGHPRLSTHVLWDTVKRRQLAPKPETCLWIVVFDGMRWDTWARHVKPRLLERFELTAPEKAYLCLLPSWTGVARTGLLAGQPPAGWKSYEGSFTTDQEQLAARLLDLPQRTRGRLLRFFSGMESDRQYGQIDPSERFPYNVLIYNLSDDNLHSQRGSLLMLNDTVDGLLQDPLQRLDNLVRPGDTLVVSSDHGFVELADGDEVTVPDDERWQRYREGGAHPVRYRYALSHDLPVEPADVCRVAYQGMRDRYTVAVGKRWFRRADWRGAPDRYAHGGLSFAEMAVPGAVLRRIVTPRLELTLETEPLSLQIDEGQSATLVVRVANQGNVQAAGRLLVRADTAAEAVSYSFELRPGERQEYHYLVVAVYRERGGRVGQTRQVTATIEYSDLAGKSQTLGKLVPVTVIPRKDVVEFDLGGLDELEI